MTETLEKEAIISSEIVRENIELLKESELAPFLLQAYDTALLLDPRLKDVPVHYYSKADLSVGQSHPSWKNNTSTHEVYIRRDQISNTETYDKKMAIEGAREIFADRIDVAPDDITPELMGVFIFLHELGHTSQYFDVVEGNTVEAFQSQRDHEQATLPTEASPRFLAYRDKFDERFADAFASAVLSQHPDIIHALSASEVEAYRAVAPKAEYPAYKLAPGESEWY